MISFDVKENAGYKVTAVKISSSDEALVVSGASSYSFTMPNADVVITVETTTVPTHALTLDLDERLLINLSLINMVLKLQIFPI